MKDEIRKIVGSIFVTARRDPSAAATEQVLVVLRKEDLNLTFRRGWDALGMRGTCTDSFIFDGQGRIEQIFPVPFAEIAETAMVPDMHILWASVWTGVAGDAYARALRYARGQTWSAEWPATRTTHRSARAGTSGICTLCR